LIETGQRHITLVAAEHGIVGHKRRRVAVGTKAQMNQIKHGRLAMVAFVGYAAAAATGRSDGPLRDLVAAVRGGG
jgi:hypothetical protein